MAIGVILLSPLINIIPTTIVMAEYLEDITKFAPGEVSMKSLVVNKNNHCKPFDNYARLNNLVDIPFILPLEIACVSIRESYQFNICDYVNYLELENEYSEVDLDLLSGALVVNVLSSLLDGILQNCPNDVMLIPTCDVNLIMHTVVVNR